MRQQNPAHKQHLPRGTFPVTFSIFLAIKSLFFRAAVEFAMSLNAEHPCPWAESFGIGAGLGFRTLILFLVAPVAFFPWVNHIKWDMTDTNWGVTANAERIGMDLCLPLLPRPLKQSKLNFISLKKLQEKKMMKFWMKLLRLWQSQQIQESAFDCVRWVTH